MFFTINTALQAWYWINLLDFLVVQIFNLQHVLQPIDTWHFHSKK